MECYKRTCWRSNNFRIPYHRQRTVVFIFSNRCRPFPIDLSWHHTVNNRWKFDKDPAIIDWDVEFDFFDQPLSLDTSLSQQDCMTHETNAQYLSWPVERNSWVQLDSNRVCYFAVCVYWLYSLHFLLLFTSFMSLVKWNFSQVVVLSHCWRRACYCL